MTSQDDPGGGPVGLPANVKRRVHKDIDRNVIIVKVVKRVKGVVNLTCGLMSEICYVIKVKIGVDTRGYTSKISGDKMEIGISLKPGVI